MADPFLRSREESSARPLALVADDHPLVRRIMVRAVAPFCDVLEATDGRQALELGLSLPVQLALLDVQMPGLDGISVASRLLQRVPAPSIILVSALFNSRSSSLYVPVGVYHCLPKPFGVSELSQLVAAALAMTATSTNS